MLWAVLLLCVGFAAGATGDSKAVYVGFDHLVTFTNEAGITATVFDYHRGLRLNSSCAVMRHPPALKNVTISDWVMDAKPELQDLEFTYMGFELFLTQNKRTGQFVYRRCRDFQPGLGELPCVAVASGVAPKLKRPWKLSYIGSNRAMLFNELTAEFGVYFFDGDVHSGGDPFHFSQPPLVSGYLTFVNSVEKTDFAFVTLPNLMGDILVAHHFDTGRMEAFQMADIKQNPHQKHVVEAKVFESASPHGLRMIPLGENQIFLFNSSLTFEVWSFAANRTNGSQSIHVKALHHYKGNVKHGHSCIRHSPESCLTTPGCSWCPTSRACLPYDYNHQSLCESRDSCPSLPWTDKSQIPASPSPAPQDLRFDNSKPSPQPSPVLPTPSPSAVSQGGEDDSSDDTVDTPAIVPDYRQGYGTTSQVQPIHPDFNNEIGKANLIIEEDNPEDVIFEINRIAHGQVFNPPAPNADADCMDRGYSLKKATEPRMDPILALSMMNSAKPYGPKNVRVSPAIPSIPSPKNSTADCEEIASSAIDSVKPWVDRGPVRAPRRAPRFHTSPTLRSMERDGLAGTEGEQLESRQPDQWMNDGAPENEYEPDEFPVEAIDQFTSFDLAMNNHEMPQQYLPKSVQDHDELFTEVDDVQDFIPLPQLEIAQPLPAKPIEVQASQPILRVITAIPALVQPIFQEPSFSTSPTLSVSPSPTPSTSPPFFPVQDGNMGNEPGATDTTPRGSTVIPIVL